MRKFLPRRFVAVAVGLALAGTLAASAWAANTAGQLDTSFGGTGYVTTPIGGFSVAQGVTNYDGGKTVAAGLTYSGITDDFAVARYNKNGSLDQSFGAGGTVTTDFGGDDQATSVAVMGDKIVVAGFTSPDGYVTNDFAIARYNKDGSLDSSFGTGGKVVTHFPGRFDNEADAVAIKGDKIVVVGFSDSDFAVARYNKDGSLDTSFGTGGLTTTDFDGGFDSANGVAFRGDSIVVAGYANYHSGNMNFALAAYDKRGALDPSFGTGGKVETDFAGGDDAGHAIDVQGDRILVVGEATVAGNDDFAAAVYDKRGMLDPKFDGNGKATMDIGSDDAAYGGAWGPDGTVIAAGTTFGVVDRFAVARWTKAGQPDPKFGTGGFTTTLIGASSDGLAMALAPEDKIVVAGISDDEFAVARYLDK